MYNVPSLLRNCVIRNCVIGPDGGGFDDLLKIYTVSLLPI